MLRLAFASRPCSTTMLKSSVDASSIPSGCASSHSFGTINDDLVDELDEPSVSILTSMVVVLTIPLASMIALRMLPDRSVSSLCLVWSVELPPFASSLSSELLLTAGCSHIWNESTLPYPY
jgi:hypothetical protein